MTKRGELQTRIGNLQNEIETSKREGNTNDLTNAAAETEIERKQEYDRQAGSGYGIAAETAAGAPAALGGMYLGRLMGKGTNALMDVGQESRNRVLARAAADRVAGLATMAGAREGAKLAGAMPSSNSAARVAGVWHLTWPLAAPWPGRAR